MKSLNDLELHAEYSSFCLQIKNDKKRQLMPRLLGCLRQARSSYVSVRQLLLQTAVRARGLDISILPAGKPPLLR